MSSELVWAPVIEQEKHGLPDRLKFILEDRFQIREDEVVLTSDEWEYLAGLRDAGVEGADKLMDAIRAYGKVKLWLEY